MKISKKDLRRIILENILNEEESQATTTGARVQNTGDGGSKSRDVELSQDDVSSFVIEIVDPIIKSSEGVKEFRAEFRIGKRAISIFREQAKNNDGEAIQEEDLKQLVSKIKKALKDSNDLSGPRGDLRTGRRFKTTYIYKSSGKSEAPTKEEPETAPNPPQPRDPEPKPTPKKDCDAKLKEKVGIHDLIGTTTPDSKQAEKDKTPKSVNDGFRYPGDNTYRYFISTVDGCWYAMNIKTCKFFSMKEYPDNMENLDAHFTNARTQYDKDKCAGRETSEDTPEDTGGEGENIPPTPKKGNSLSLKEQALIMLMAHGASRTLGALGPQIAMLYEDGENNNKESAFKEVIKQVQRSDANPIMNVNAAVRKFITPKADGGYLDLNRLGQYSRKGSWKALMNQKGPGPALKEVLAAGAAWDLPRFDEADFPREHLEDLKNALAKYLGVPGGTLNESSYGKSRGTLLRERYWGRY